MKFQRHVLKISLAVFVGLAVVSGAAIAKSTKALKKEIYAEVDQMAPLTQQMVDSIFSFGELGFQEFETSKYLVGILKQNGFTVEEGISGIPTAWVATWGNGRPIISMGSDIDGIPKASQKPGVAYHDPLVEGAPGHGEGHNSGNAVTVTAAIALKKIMQRDSIPGTLVLWPGVAEELVSAKAFYVRDGLFKDVDAVLFTHVSDNMSVATGPARGNGLVSMEYTFYGDAAHSAGAPWRGKSALDAVELVNMAWNLRREHLRLSQRTHYVITNGGDQPNVVPSLASVWYYHRETDYEHIKQLVDMGEEIARGAALMTNTTMSKQLLGTAWPQHFNDPIAQAMYQNIAAVGLPTWSEQDQALAKALQKELGNKKVEGLSTKLSDQPKRLEVENMGGGSDDIGDVSWNVPTVTLRFPANIPDLPGHHWANAISMATPIAHKGSTAGAKVLAATALDLLTDPKLLKAAKKYFVEVQTKDENYIPFLAADTKPPVYLNKKIMDEYRDEMRKFYYDPNKYGSYLEQLGIDYPTVKSEAVPNAK